jgi:hypothetical protein
MVQSRVALADRVLLALVRVGDESIAEIESAVDVPVALAVVGLGIAVAADPHRFFA